MTFQVEIVADAERFRAIEAQWQRLWEQSGTHIFQTHAWIHGWITGINDRRDIRLQIALVWDDTDLVGIMPCAVHRRFGLRVLRWAAQLFSDYCDCVINMNYSPAVVMTRLWEGMRQAGGFDLISLQQVRPDAQCRSFLAGILDIRGDAALRCMRIDNCWPDGHAFFRSLNKKSRNNFTRGKRILGELGGEVAFEVIEFGQPIEALFEEVLRLKTEWIRVHDPKSALLTHDRPVLDAVLEGVWQTGMAKLFLLTCNGQIAAASINFVYANRMEAYLTSYDAQYERASPGTILIVDYAQWSFDHNLRLVDFLRGEEAFKFRMANAETTISSFDGSRTLVGHLVGCARRWIGKRRQQKPKSDDEATDNGAIDPVEA
jgi:CelD/BcsL family acetyltransferase involved in cellulose biosynthesis